uniref:Uncharacterized protein n=1 Tax=Oryza meridionalis TaxID=40149 RepID=A0A0E0F3B7_9ORYZ
MSTPLPISLTRPRLHVAVTSEQASYHLSAIPSSSNLRTPPATSPYIKPPLKEPTADSARAS